LLKLGAVRDWGKVGVPCLEKTKKEKWESFMSVPITEKKSNRRETSRRGHLETNPQKKTEKNGDHSLLNRKGGDHFTYLEKESVLKGERRANLVFRYGKEEQKKKQQT